MTESIAVLQIFEEIYTPVPCRKRDYIYFLSRQNDFFLLILLCL